MLFRKQKTKKEEGRPILGFHCDKRISDSVRAGSREIGLPIGSLAEHCLGVGVAQMAADLKDEQSRICLWNHLLEQHFLKPLYELENPVDLNAAIKAQRRQLAHWELDRMAHTIVRLVEREGIPAEFFIKMARAVIEEARRKHGNETHYERRRP